MKNDIYKNNLKKLSLKNVYDDVGLLILFETS